MALTSDVMPKLSFLRNNSSVAGVLIMHLLFFYYLFTLKCRKDSFSIDFIYC